MADHTPAPWAWFTGKHPVDPLRPHMKWLVGADGQGFAMTPGLNEPTDTANANLLIAAPELLAACHRAVRMLEQKQGVDAVADSVLQQCAAAIAKAEGR
jgi:hypothetical protein